MPAQVPEIASENDIEIYFRFLCACALNEGAAGPAKALKKYYFLYLKNILKTDESLVLDQVNNKVLLERMNFISAQRPDEFPGFILERIEDGIRNTKLQSEKFNADEKQELLSDIDSISRDDSCTMESYKLKLKEMYPEEKKEDAAVSLPQAFSELFRSNRFLECLAFMESASMIMSGLGTMSEEQKEFIKLSSLKLVFVFTLIDNSIDIDKMPYEKAEAAYNSFRAHKSIPLNILDDGEKNSYLANLVSFIEQSIASAQILEDRRDFAAALRIIKQADGAAELLQDEHFHEEMGAKRMEKIGEDYIDELTATLEDRVESLNAKLENAPVRKRKLSADLFPAPEDKPDSKKGSKKDEKPPENKPRKRK